MLLHVDSVQFVKETKFMKEVMRDPMESASQGIGFKFVHYLPSIMTVACGFVPGDLVNVDPSTTRRDLTPNTLYLLSTTLPMTQPPWKCQIVVTVSRHHSAVSVLLCKSGRYGPSVLLPTEELNLGYKSAMMGVTVVYRNP